MSAVTKVNRKSYGAIIIAIPNIIQNIRFNDCMSPGNLSKNSEMVIAHYTTTEVLDILLSTATFRASNLLYQNDALEYIHGIRSMRKLLEDKQKDLEKRVNTPGEEETKIEKDVLKQVKSIVGNLENEELDLEHFRNERGIYTISFSTQTDLLSQWITYARESGVSIELDTDLLFRDAIFDQNKETFFFVPKIRYRQKKTDNSGTDSAVKEPKGELPIEERAKEQLIKEQVDSMYLEKAQAYYHYKTSDVLKRIQYFGSSAESSSTDDGSSGLNIIDEQHLIDLIVEKWQTLNCEENKDLAMPFLQLLASYIKNSLFSAEKEVRASFYSIEGNLSWLNSVDLLEKDFEDAIGYYRMAHGILRPYMEVKLCSKGGNRRDKLKPCLPIKSITVGPSGSQQLVFDSVVHRLKYGQNKVYDYTKDVDLFQKRWDAYTYEVERWLKDERNVSIEDEASKQLKYLLATQWKSEMGETGSADNLLSYIDVGKHQAPQADNASKSAPSNDLKKHLKEINQYFYFSKDGIIVRKSMQSYIF